MWSRPAPTPATRSRQPHPVRPPRRPPTPRYRDKPSNLQALAVAAGPAGARSVTWCEGTRVDADNPTAAMSSRFLALRVRPANHDIPRDEDGALPEV